MKRRNKREVGKAKPPSDSLSEANEHLEPQHQNAVTTALSEKLAATEDEALGQQRLAGLLTLANAIAGRLTPEQKAFDMDAELYNERGLPR